MAGSAVSGAPTAMCLGVCGSVAGPAYTAAHFAFNGAPREADVFGNRFITQSRPAVVLNLDRLCFGEGWLDRLCFSLSN